MKELGIEIEVYCASEIDEQAMQVGIEKLSTMNINSLPVATLTKQFTCTTGRNKAGSLKGNQILYFKS